MQTFKSVIGGSAVNTLSQSEARQLLRHILLTQKITVTKITTEYYWDGEYRKSVEFEVTPINQGETKNETTK